MLMFKERVGAVIIYLYLRLHRYRARGGDLTSLLEQGKKDGAQYVQQMTDKLPEVPESVVNANNSAKEMLASTAESAKQAVKDPRKAAGDVIENVSDRVVEVVKTARDALSGDKNTETVKEVVNDAVDTAKGEVKGAIEQAKKK
jgi:vacuolar-type H+-ATPase subunit H